MRTGAWNVSDTPPSIFVRRLQARPSSPRRAPLCTGPPTRCCLGTAINHHLPAPHFPPSSVPEVWESPSPSWDEVEPSGDVCEWSVPLCCRGPHLLMRWRGWGWVIIAEAAGKTRLVSIPSGAASRYRNTRPHLLLGEQRPHCKDGRHPQPAADCIFKTRALGCTQRFDESGFHRIRTIKGRL